MGEVKIKNSGNPVIIGGILVPGGNKVTPVDEAALNDYSKAVAGSHVFTNFLTVVDEDYEKRKKVEAEAAKNMALNEARKKIEPMIREELAEKIGKEFSEKIEGLEKLNADLVKENEALKKANIEALAGNASASGDGEGAEKTDDKPDDGEFVFDPEKHHIEHRGAGKWWVMDQEEKVHGPLSAEDRAKFEELLK